MNLAHSSNNAMPKGGKIGQKQSVLKRSCRRKIPKFKGVQKQKKLPVEVARNSATEITFVGEDDIVSEQIPPPAASASFRKLAVECTESSSDESMDPKGEIPEGYRLVSINSLVEFAMFLRYLVISPTSDFANVTFANVFGRLANVLLVTSPMY